MNLKRPLFVSIAVLLVVFWSDFLLARESVLTIQAKEENGTPVPGLKLFDTETGHASGRTNKEGFTTLPIDSRVGSTVRLGISPNKDGKLEWDFVSPENGDLIIPEGFSAQITLRRRTSLPDSLKLYIKDAEDQPISNIRIRNKKTSKTSRLSAEGFTALPLLPTERPGSIIRLAIAPDTTSGTVDWVWVEPPKGETPIPEDFYCEIILKRRTTSPDTVGIAVPNRRPRADAGADLVGYLGETLHLDGSSSLDQDDDPLRWNWRQVAGPLAALTEPSAERTPFTPQRLGQYYFQLTVHDGSVNSIPDTVGIAVRIPWRHYITPSLAQYDAGRTGRGRLIRGSLAVGAIWAGYSQIKFRNFNNKYEKTTMRFETTLANYDNEIVPMLVEIR